MKYFFLVVIILQGFTVWAQRTPDYIDKMAFNANIKQPVPPKFAFKTVRVPIKTDSISLVNFHTKYYRTMEAGTVLLTSGSLITVAHIIIAALAPGFSRNAVIAIATVGVATATAGSIVLPLGASERHRYKRSLKIALAKRAL